MADSPRWQPAPSYDLPVVRNSSKWWQFFAGSLLANDDNWQKCNQRGFKTPPAAAEKTIPALAITQAFDSHGIDSARAATSTTKTAAMETLSQMNDHCAIFVSAFFCESHRRQTRVTSHLPASGNPGARSTD